MFYTNGGDAWNDKAGWLNNQSHCSWTGITCDSSSHVTDINLPGNNLSGSMTDLSGLSSIRTIVLDVNSLTGPIPSNVCAISNTILLTVDDNLCTDPGTAIGCCPTSAPTQHPVPAPVAPPVTVVPEFKSCLNAHQWGRSGWVFKGVLRTEAEARAACAGYKYMSLECPHGGGFYTLCVNVYDANSVIADGECQGNPTDLSINNGSNGGCVGPYKWDTGIYVGGWRRGALYEL